MKMGKHSNVAGHIEPDLVIRFWGGLHLFAERDMLLELCLTF